MRKKYINPPITEIVMGVYLKEPIIKFRSEHVGLYWSQIVKEFPKSAQNVMIGDLDIPVPGEVFPMPRYWFVSEDESYLVQVQRNAFLLNWRKRQEEYPHYEPFKKKFDKNYVDFVEFCGKEFDVSDLQIERCELTCINVIEDTPYFRSFSDVQNVMPTYSPLTFGKDSERPDKFNLQYVYDRDEDLSLTVSLQSRHNLSTGNEALYFELRTGGMLSGHAKSDADIWFNRAHDLIGEAFNGLTNPDIQQEHWQLKED